MNMNTNMNTNLNKIQFIIYLFISTADLLFLHCFFIRRSEFMAAAASKSEILGHN